MVTDGMDCYTVSVEHRLALGNIQTFRVVEGGMGNRCRQDGELPEVTTGQGQQARAVGGKPACKTLGWVRNQLCSGVHLWRMYRYALPPVPSDARI